MVNGFPDLRKFFGGGSSDDVICNPNSTFSCPCEKCWETSKPFVKNGSEWLAVEFQKCLPMTKNLEKQLREKIASWLNEECAFVLNCRIFSLQSFTQKNVIIGGNECQNENDKTKGVLYLTVLLNLNETKIYEATQVPATILGSVIQAREHLLSSLVAADMDSVVIVERVDYPFNDYELQSNSAVSPKKLLQLTSFAFASMIISFIATFCLICSCFCCFVGRIQWSSFGSSKWFNGTNPKKKKIKTNVELKALKSNPESVS
uniref:Uncharacterized protein n=1 Tax=Panagrolaimus sp. JU765 TaxID=591449 RepID=A0AC34Q7G0_9BILA